MALMRIMIITDSWSIYSKGLYSLIAQMLKEGNEVVCVLPENELYDKKLKNGKGLKLFYIPLSKRKNMPLSIKFISYLIMVKIILRPDKILLHLDKKTVFAAFISRFIKDIQISSIISDLNILNGFISIFYKLLYKSILRHSETAFYVYQDDYDLAEKYGFKFKDRSIVLRGWGVDLNYYKKMPIPETDLVYMSMPLLCCHGVKCFTETAKLVREKYPKVRFILTGKFIEDPAVFTAAELDEACENHYIYYVEDVGDIRPFMEVCSIFVQPNVTVKEGYILEAEATGRPVLASDHPVNRSLMIEGYNGFILPVNEASKWAEKIMLLLENPELKEKMSEFSYKLCSLRYNRKDINSLIIERLGKNYFNINI